MVYSHTTNYVLCVGETIERASKNKISFINRGTFEFYAVEGREFESCLVLHA